VVPVTLAIRAGFAALSLNDLKSLQLHDVVLVHSPLGANEMLAVAGERYGARVKSAHGKFTLAGSLFPLGEDQKRVWSMAENADDAVGNRALDGNLDDIQIKLVFEIGRKEIELGDLRRLSEGHVFDLGRDTRTAVDILAGSRRIGQGELVQVHEALGVRITRLFDHG
jgi:type III secretion protein Q